MLGFEFPSDAMHILYALEKKFEKQTLALAWIGFGSEIGLLCRFGVVFSFSGIYP